jgi:hypothetical protein
MQFQKSDKGSQMQPPLLNEKENAKASAFMKKHYTMHKRTAAVILTATATGIASHIEIECPHCHKKEDISDYESW